MWRGVQKGGEVWVFNAKIKSKKADRCRLFSFSRDSARLHKEYRPHPAAQGPPNEALRMIKSGGAEGVGGIRNLHTYTVGLEIFIYTHICAYNRRRIVYAVLRLRIF